MTLIAMIIAYFIGAIPTGLWLGMKLRNIDIREHGSGNLGATNAFRVLGPKIGTIVLLLDVLKGLVPVVLLPLILGMRPVSEGQEMLIGACAILGHVFSIFADFHGGKGVATSLGVFLAIATAPMVILLVIGGALISIYGYVSLASVTGAVLLPILLFMFGYAPIVLFAGIVVSLAVIWRHRANLERLMQGRELRIFDRHSDQHDEQPIPPIRSDHDTDNLSRQ